MRYFCCVLFTLLLTACGQSTYNELDPDAIILAFGDSLTAGVGTTPQNSYPAVLAKLSDRTVVNGGISGETTSQGLVRFAHLLDQHNPQLIILLEGGNDILHNQPFATTKNNLAAMINETKSRGIPLLLLAVPEKNLFSRSAPFYRELAEEHDVLFMRDLVSDLLRTSNYKSDTVHLNAAGYEAMAEAVFDFLQDQGLL